MTCRHRRTRPIPTPAPEAALRRLPGALPLGALLLAGALAAAGCGGGSQDPPAAEQASSERAWSELLPNAHRPLPDVVSGGQPSPEQLARAAEAGYRTVINLRTPGEPGSEGEADRVQELGMEYAALPIDGAAGVTKENARALAALLESAERPVLLHCGSGNRVGALLALSAYHVEGKSADEALRYGLDSGLTRLEPAVREHLDAAARTPRDGS